MKPLCFMFAMSCAARPACAGTVSFVPQTPTTVPQGEPISFQVVVAESESAQFEEVWLLAASYSHLVFAFEYDNNFATGGLPAPPAVFGVFPSDLHFGAARSQPPLFAAPLLTGVLSVDTSETPLGEHEIFVSSSEESLYLGDPISQIQPGNPWEPLEGRTSITIIPEPATFIALLLCCVGVCCRPGGI